MEHRRSWEANSCTTSQDVLVLQTEQFSVFLTRTLIQKTGLQITKCKNEWKLEILYSDL